MGDISRRLSRAEFKCKCQSCGFATVDIGLVGILEEVATHFERKRNADRVFIMINSACRCREYNEVVQKRSNPRYVPYTSNSRHMYGMAVDFYLVMQRGRIKAKIDPKMVVSYLDKTYPKSLGLGYYPTFTHVDVGERRRW